MVKNSAVLRHCKWRQKTCVCFCPVLLLFFVVVGVNLTRLNVTLSDTHSRDSLLLETRTDSGSREILVLEGMDSMQAEMKRRDKSLRKQQRSFPTVVFRALEYLMRQETGEELYPVLEYISETEWYRSSDSKLRALAHDSANHRGISIVTQCSMDRIQVVRQLAQRWTGPICLAIFLKSKNENSTKSRNSMRAQFEEIDANYKRTTLRIALVYAPEFGASQKKRKVTFPESWVVPMGYGRFSTKRTVRVLRIMYKFAYQKLMTYGMYPINTLRNVALKMAISELVFLTDVDFIPSLDLHDSILRSTFYILHLSKNRNKTKTMANERHSAKFDSKDSHSSRRRRRRLQLADAGSDNEYNDHSTANATDTSHNSVTSKTRTVSETVSKRRRQFSSERQWNRRRLKQRLKRQRYTRVGVQRLQDSGGESDAVEVRQMDGSSKIVNLDGSGNGTGKKTLQDLVHASESKSGVQLQSDESSADGKFGGSITPENVALVIPAFELSNENETELVSGLKVAAQMKEAFLEEKTIPFHLSGCQHCHLSSNYVHWVCAKDAWYPTVFVWKYEPYIVVRRDGLRKYDERFRGYGMNKAAHIASLSVLDNTALYVFGTGFLLELPHSKSSTHSVWKRDSKVKEYNNYLGFSLYEELSAVRPINLPIAFDFFDDSSMQ